VSPKSELGFLCAFDSVVHQELWVYGFHKEYHQMLKDVGAIVFRPSNWTDAVDEVVDSMKCQIGSGE
jgi:hypothetical protein